MIMLGNLQPFHAHEAIRGPTQFQLRKLNANLNGGINSAPDCIRHGDSRWLRKATPGAWVTTTPPSIARQPESLNYHHNHNRINV